MSCIQQAIYWYSKAWAKAKEWRVRIQKNNNKTQVQNTFKWLTMSCGRLCQGLLYMHSILITPAAASRPSRTTTCTTTPEVSYFHRLCHRFTKLPLQWLQYHETTEYLHTNNTLNADKQHGLFYSHRILHIYIFCMNCINNSVIGNL